MIGDSPPNKLFLTADVLVVTRFLHNVRNAHDEVLKRLCLLSEEVEEVAEAAVLCDHEHRS